MGFSDECIEAAGPVWERWLHHPWTEALFAGELRDDQFRYWLIQDLPYLGQQMTGTCKIAKAKKKGAKTYVCKIRLMKGTWTLTTEARTGATVIARTVKTTKVK